LRQKERKPKEESNDGIKRFLNKLEKHNNPEFISPHIMDT
jgi:hypothetical protein